MTRVYHTISLGVGMSEKVLDFVGKRKENIENKRRNFERLLFQNFLGAYTVIKQDDVIYPVKMVDISQDGCLFQVPWDPKRDHKIDRDTELTMRIYFTDSSYIPLILEVKYGNEYVDEHGQTYMQYGCEFDKSLPSFDAMASFIEFMYQFAEHSALDRGDIKTFFY